MNGFDGGSSSIPGPGTVVDTALARGSVWVPADNGLLAANGDPNNFSANAIMVVGSVYQMKLIIPYAMTVSNIWMAINTVGGTLGSGSRVTVASMFNASGTELAVTADQSTNWSTLTGAFAMPITSVALAAGQVIYVCLICGSATTAPTPNQGSSQITVVNANLTGANLRAGRNGTGLGSMPASITPANAVVTAAKYYWIGLS